MSPCACDCNGRASLMDAPGLRETTHGDEECRARWLDESGPDVVIRACRRCEELAEMARRHGLTLTAGCPHTRPA